MVRLLYLIIYVDDIAVTRDHRKEMAKLKEFAAREFNIDLVRKGIS